MDFNNHIEGDKLQQKDYAKYLGVYIDSQLIGFLSLGTFGF